MNPKPEPSRGMPRSLIYAMIPLGFILLVGIMILTGYWTEETADAPTVVEEELIPPADDSPAVDPDAPTLD